MKIDAVAITLFAWDDVPPTKYTQGTQNTSGRSNLGLLRIGTDDGIEGHAFLGSATNPAETDAGPLIRFLKPALMGKDPLAREDLHAAMRARQRNLGLRAIGACDTALWDIVAKAAGMPLYKYLGGGRAAIGTYASSQILEGREAYAAEALRFKADGCGNSLNNLAQLHFACAIRNTTYFEVLLPHGAHKYGLVEDIQIGKDGLAHCPQAPGVGGNIDFDLIERKRLAHLS